MTIKQKDIIYTVGIDDLFTCFQTVEGNSTTAPEYEEDVYRQSNITDLTISQTVAQVQKWASNKKIINIARNTSYGLAFNLAGLDREIRDKMLGIVRNRGFAFNKANPKSLSKFAIGVVFPQSDGSFLLRWYPNCSVQPSDQSYQTQGEEMVINDTAYQITADPLPHNNITYVELDTGAEDAPEISVEDFMKQVIFDESQIDTLFPETP